MERRPPRVHPAHMYRDGHGHFLREWRKAKELTLEQVAERIEMLSKHRAILDPNARPVPMTHATLSRIERGRIPYNQHLLELLAEIYQTTPDALIRIDPTRPGVSWSILETLRPEQQEQIRAIVEVMAKRTGTEG